ncbi:MAG: family 10 glycosylhydrolase [Chloroflexi bacterium]|nr:family 10 glycosylhydrolase [Chloroflexota bacterium]
MTILKRILLFGMTIALLAGCAPQKINLELEPESMRGVWVQRKSVTTREDIDEVIRRVELGRFKQIFVGVFTGGMVLYPSEVAVQRYDVEAGFDPLAYLVQEAHGRNIQVHAWFEVGRVADAKGSSVVIEKHPDWGLVGPDGKTLPWLNFSHPDARQFISDLVMEAMQRGVDGIHFDYTRYPGAEWGFDNYSISAFNQGHDFDLNELRYAEIPAYGLFEGNALLLPSTAQVLASFSNGYPAVMLNQFGNGQALILNWQAHERKTAIGDEILKRGIQALKQENGLVYLLQSERTAAKYGQGDFDDTYEWLASFIGNPFTITPAELDGLDPDSVLVLPAVYLFSEEEAARLARFVDRGGGAIFIDSPTPSMNLKDLRAVTGMQAAHDHFEDWLLMTPNGAHDLIPTADRPTDLDFYEQRNTQWRAFRMEGINSLLREVYGRVKETAPHALVTVTITSDIEQARQENLQDWQAWLDEGYIDLLIPRAYAATFEELDATLSEWSSTFDRYGRLSYGLIAYVDYGDEEEQKSPRNLIQEIELAVRDGSDGYLLFDLEHISDAQLEALAKSIP